MRIALALSGYFNNIADPNSGMNGFAYIKKILLDKYDVDCFIHSWEPENEFLFNELYKPVYATYESQIDFTNIMKEEGISQDYFDEDFNRNHSPVANCRIQSTLSFLHGRKKVLNLVSLYERKKKIQYDFVVCCRFDLGQRDKFGDWQFHVSQMNFEPEKIGYGQEKIWSAYYDQLNQGLADQWFFMSSNDARILATVYDRALKYFQPGSEYERTVTEGWPDSNLYNCHDPNDQRQFTNEIFLSLDKKSKNLMKYEKWNCVNNHILYKYFMIEQGYWPDKLGFTIS